MRYLRNSALSTFCLAAALLCAKGVRADTFTFTYSDSAGDMATGTLTATASGIGDDSLLVTSGTLDITAAPGVSDVVGIYNLIPVGPEPTPGWTPIYYIADDLLYPANDAALGVDQGEAVTADPSYLTLAGLVFGSTGPNEQDEVNIWGTGGAVYTISTETADVVTLQQDTGAFTLVETPEPGTIGLLCVGILMLGLMVGSKKMQLNSFAA